MEKELLPLEEALKQRKTLTGFREQERLKNQKALTAEQQRRAQIAKEWLVEYAALGEGFELEPEQIDWELRGDLTAGINEDMEYALFIVIDSKRVCDSYSTIVIRQDGSTIINNSPTGFTWLAYRNGYPGTKHFSSILNAILFARSGD